MTVTITLHDPLASQLKSVAQQQQMTIEKLVTDVLAGALSIPDGAAWHKLNQRRLILVRKSATGGLNSEEVNELQHLQTLADIRVDELDSQRLAEVRRIEQEVTATLHQPGSS